MGKMLIHMGGIISAAAVTTLWTRNHYHDGVAKTFSDPKIRSLYEEYWAGNYMNLQTRWICEKLADASYMKNLKNELKLRNALRKEKNKLLAAGVKDHGKIEELESMLRHGFLTSLSAQEAVDMVDGGGELLDVLHKSDYFSSVIPTIGQLLDVDAGHKVVEGYHEFLHICISDFK